jgi:hypothetical protein
MGKCYDYDTTSFIGGVAPAVDKHYKDIKKTEHDKGKHAHKKKGADKKSSCKS